MFVKKAIAAVGGGTDAPSDPKFASHYPALWEYLSVTRLEDGSTRKLAKLSLSVQDGRWCACFVDEDNKRLMFISGETYDQLLKSLEKHLANETAEWRRCKPFKKGG